MTTTILQEAIAAARAGDIPRARQLAADNVQANPDDANSWYLLSQLVDSDARRAAYLGKTLAIDPDHARARVEFDALPPALAAELAPAAGPVVEPPAVAEPLAAADHAPDDLMAVAVATATAEAAAEPPALESAPPDDLPEWLQPLSPEPMPLEPMSMAGASAAVAASSETIAMTGEAVAGEMPAPPPAAPRPRPAAAPRPQPAPKRNGGNQALSILLGLLALLTVVVLGFLIYLLLV